MKIVIESIEDSTDCETCGGGYASGFNVDIDDVPFGDFSPLAHCYDSTSYSIEQVMTAILKEKFNVEVEFN